MKVSLGTTNPAKVKRFSELLSGGDVEFLTLEFPRNLRSRGVRRRKMQF